MAQAVDALFEEYRTWARAVGRRVARQSGRLSGDEVEQAALVGLWLAARVYDPARGEFKTFAWHRIRGEIRTLRGPWREQDGRAVECSAPASEPATPASCNPLREAIDREQSRRILRMVSSTPRWRTVLRLTALGYSAVEIGARLGLSRRWVQIILKRARARACAKYRASVGAERGKVQGDV